MKIALFPGTFDPPTLGHVDLIRRSTAVCDQLYVGIGINTAKAGDSFTMEERVAMLEAVCAPFPHAKVVTFETLAVDFARKNNIDFLVRGLRTLADFEHETHMALANRHLSGIETLFLMADARLCHISSTLIRELGHFKTRLHDFVPPEIEDQVFRRLSR